MARERAHELHRSALGVSLTDKFVQKCPSCEPLFPAPAVSSLVLCNRTIPNWYFARKIFIDKLIFRRAAENPARTKATSAQPLPNHSHEGPFCATGQARSKKAAEPHGPTAREEPANATLTLQPQAHKARVGQCPDRRAIQYPSHREVAAL